MTPELGHYALVLALALGIVQGSVPFYGARRNDPVLMATAVPTAVAQFAFVGISFAALTLAYVGSDFSVVNVFENSHSLKPLIYKITGVWGNHEGSMLLWVTVLAVAGAAVALFERKLRQDTHVATLAAQATTSASSSAMPASSRRRTASASSPTSSMSHRNVGSTPRRRSFSR